MVDIAILSPKKSELSMSRWGLFHFRSLNPQILLQLLGLCRKSIHGSEMWGCSVGKEMISHKDFSIYFRNKRLAVE
jgi:hypothetical protein